MSFRHGTAEGLRHCKPPCAKCVAFKRGDPVPDTDPHIPAVQSVPSAFASPPDIISFLHAGRFNSIVIDQTSDDMWSATVKAHGDLYVGHGYLADYALFDAAKRYYNSQPETAPLTMTYDPATRQTSEGHALDTLDEVTLEEIWPEDSLNISDEL